MNTLILDGGRGNRFTIYVCMLSCFSRVQFFVTPWTVQAPLSMEIFQARMVGEGNGKPLQYSCLENPMD